MNAAEVEILFSDGNQDNNQFVLPFDQNGVDFNHHREISDGITKYLMSPENPGSGLLILSALNKEWRHHNTDENNPNHPIAATIAKSLFADPEIAHAISSFRADENEAKELGNFVNNLLNEKLATYAKDENTNLQLVVLRTGVAQAALQMAHILVGDKRDYLGPQNHSPQYISSEDQRRYVNKDYYYDTVNTWLGIALHGYDFSVRQQILTTLAEANVVESMRDPDYLEMFKPILERNGLPLSERIKRTFEEAENEGSALMAINVEITETENPIYILAELMALKITDGSDFYNPEIPRLNDRITNLKNVIEARGLNVISNPLLFSLLTKNFGLTKEQAEIIDRMGFNSFEDIVKKELKPGKFVAAGLDREVAIKLRKEINEHIKSNAKRLEEITENLVEERSHAQQLKILCHNFEKLNSDRINTFEKAYDLDSTLKQYYTLLSTLERRIDALKLEARKITGTSE